jgi:hypothetical protein
MPWSVRSAASSSTPWGLGPSFAPVRVVAVTTTERRRRVFNLSVEGEPEFFANGILVHNCTFDPETDKESPHSLDAWAWACQPHIGGVNRVGSDADLQVVPYS